MPFAKSRLIRRDLGVFGVALSNMVATSQPWLFNFKLIAGNKIKNTVPQSLDTFQALSSHTWQVAMVLDSTDTEHFHHLGKFPSSALGLAL